MKPCLGCGEAAALSRCSQCTAPDNRAPGTSAELLSLITPTRLDWKAPKDWPTARQLTGTVKRRAPSLRRIGWTVEEAEKDPRARAVRFKLTPPPDDLRVGGNDARNARDARTEDIGAGQSTYERRTGLRASCERRSQHPG